MLILTRGVGEIIHIGNTITLTVLRIEDLKVAIGIHAPRDVEVFRHEIFRRIQAERFGHGDRCFGDIADRS